jgi:L,D-peptidoglycan transpeptidase YkuD (ErfK/YbiS/YcfS/YnhG family)
MTGESSIHRRKAAAWRRRLFLLVFGFLTCGGIHWASLEAEQPYNVAGARSVLTRAVVKLAPEMPDKAQHVRVTMNLAEQITAGEAASSVWERDNQRVVHAWTRALDVSHGYLVELRKSRLDASARWEKLQKEAETALARARTDVAAPGLTRKDTALMSQAEVAYERAKRQAASGLAAEAARSAEIAIQRSAEVSRAWSALHARFEDRGALRDWGVMVRATIAESERDRSTVFIIDKLRRQLEVYSQGKRIATFTDVELGSRGLKQKMHAGDKATPEGRYRVTEVRSRGQTKYYKALMLDYPNSEDRRRFEQMRRRGTIPKGVGPGSLIEIHGHGGRGKDWTDGCIALKNSEMDRLFQWARVNTAVTIVGTIP